MTQGRVTSLSYDNNECLRAMGDAFPGRFGWSVDPPRQIIQSFLTSSAVATSGAPEGSPWFMGEPRSRLPNSQTSLCLARVASTSVGTAISVLRLIPAIRSVRSRRSRFFSANRFAMFSRISSVARFRVTVSLRP